MYRISKQLKELSDSILKVKENLKLKIESLPINPHATQLGGGCFTISSAAIFSDKQMNLSAEHYDYQGQYNTLCSIIDDTSAENVFSRLAKICEDGYLIISKHNARPHRITFHPDVIKAVKEVIAEN